MGKSAISMDIFNSYVSLPGRVYPINIPLNHDFNLIKSL